MEKAILIRYAEIHLKGLNRPFFERKLIERIKYSLRGFKCNIKKEQGRIYIFGLPAEQLDAAAERLQRVFGIHSLSIAYVADKDWEAVKTAAFMAISDAKGSGPATFKVSARRADKHFFMTSDAINRELGHEILQKFPDIKVDVHKPDIMLGVEIRDRAYVYSNEIACSKGMPTGSAGKAALLISGGIDSPVAGYMMAKRGLELSAVHFYSFPYTSERARDKVIELTKAIARYAGSIRLHLVPFTDIQLAIYEKCPPRETTVLMRRLMMRISEMIAKQDGALALITGESLGQVASQTLESLCATDDAVDMPVFRPLIGFDKEEIIDLAKKIGTFETSILPYEDCCTVFVPEHPVTKPDVAQLRNSESLVDFTEMIEAALKNTETMEIF